MTNETIPRSADFHLTREPSKAARERILSRAGIGVLMIHFEVDARALQHDVPFVPEYFNGLTE